MHLVLIINIYMCKMEKQQKLIWLNSQKHMSSQEDAGLL